MPRRSPEIKISNFSGGIRTAVGITELNRNQSYDLSNLVVAPDGYYFRTRYGNITFNSSAMNSGAAVQGLSYFKLNNSNDFLVSVCGNKIFKSDGLDGTMDDITGAVSITSGQDNIWSFITFNNVHIGFGGPSTNPDAPIQYTGSGNAATLSGTPPSAYGCFYTNNRVFAFRTSASPSILQWSILGSGQDWTGTGSGTQTISTSDGDSITAAAVIDNSLTLIFKQRSVHKLLTSNLVSSAFPVVPLFRNTGCAGKHAVVVVDGVCYFITPTGEMNITDGEKIVDSTELPSLSNIDNLWSSGNSSRYEYVQGHYVKGEDYRHIVWIMTSTSSGTTHDVALVWDIDNKCWLRHKTGFKANVITTTQSGSIYTGHYNGVIYQQDVSTATTDASESDSNIDSYWSSGWDDFGSYDTHKTIQDAYISFSTQTSGNIIFSYGYDFNNDQKSKLIDQRADGEIIGEFIIGTGLVGGQTDFVDLIHMLGNGRVFKYKIRNNDYKMKINSLSFIGHNIQKEKVA